MQSSQYPPSLGNQISILIEKFDFSEDKGGFDYLTKVSAVYSSNIEGNSIAFVREKTKNKDRQTIISVSVTQQMQKILDMLLAYD